MTEADSEQRMAASRPLHKQYSHGTLHLHTDKASSDILIPTSFGEEVSLFRHTEKSGNKKDNKHNAELQRADPVTKVTG